MPPTTVPPTPLADQGRGLSPAGRENIAKGYRGAAGDLTTIGVGLDTDGWLWTQDFGY